jgi:hypothetical protein
MSRFLAEESTAVTLIPREDALVASFVLTTTIIESSLANSLYSFLIVRVTMSLLLKVFSP